MPSKNVYIGIKLRDFELSFSRKDFGTFSNVRITLYFNIFNYNKTTPPAHFICCVVSPQVSHLYSVDDLIGTSLIASERGTQKQDQGYFSRGGGRIPFLSNATTVFPPHWNYLGLTHGKRNFFGCVHLVHLCQKGRKARPERRYRGPTHQTIETCRTHWAWSTQSGCVTGTCVLQPPPSPSFSSRSNTIHVRSAPPHPRLIRCKYFSHGVCWDCGRDS
ncbi:hypothetical protein JTE90_027366 [Oedothorax gibbosus]|uniref:Uncharacterized protein n=1 Tax=Oedothorax gibbosus TaxID=931172 RepID=A0AAV6W2R9_9ARAC|nr:hypothetical protein JTE90_027366 [Oedothorax gibbosus]